MSSDQALAKWFGISGANFVFSVAGGPLGSPYLRWMGNRNTSTILRAIKCRRSSVTLPLPCEAVHGSA